MKKFIQSPLGIGITVFVAVLALGTLLSHNGYHLSLKGIVRGGDIAITLPTYVETEDFAVYLDGEELRTNDTTSDNIYYIKNVKPGAHQVLLSTKSLSRWPWQKTVITESEMTTTLTPFLLPRNPSGVIIMNNDPSYNTYRAEILNTPQATREKPILSEARDVALFIEDKNIIAVWQGSDETIPAYFCTIDVCEKEVTIFEGVDTVRNVAFFKDTSDVVMYSSLNGVFALEIDMRTDAPNFQPIYKGPNEPRFKKVDDRTVRILGGNSIFEITL